MRSLIDLPRLVLVEDSDEDDDTVREALRHCGIAAHLERVISGDACMALLATRAYSQPALVLMDLNTPGMDGRETLILMKADPALKDIPVVVVSTSANPRDLSFCYGAGANAYHVKPVRYSEHLSAMVGVLTYWLGGVTLPTRFAAQP